MRQFSIPYKSLVLLVMLAFAAITVMPAAAQGAGAEVEITGTVMSIDAAAGSFVVETEDGTNYTVFPGEAFDFTTIAVGDMVEVEGTLNEDGSIAAFKVTVEMPEDVEITGKVISIDTDAGSFVVETEDGTSYTVFPGETFDFTTIAVGDIVKVEGTLNEDGSIAATKVEVKTPDDDGDPEDGPSTGYYCTQSDVQHPFGARLAEHFGTDYAVLQSWFCSGLGWGQIMLALQTSQITGSDPAALLEARESGTGWGQIWHELLLTGRPEKTGPPSDLDGDGKPDHAGPPNDLDGDGKPDHAGPPNDLDGDGKPDHAGPPSDLDGDGKPDKADQKTKDRPGKP